MTKRIKNIFAILLFLALPVCPLHSSATFSGVQLSDVAVDGTPATFSPSDIANLRFWLKADGTLWQDSARTTPVTSDADPVGAWDDESGNSFHVIQATAGSRPTYKTNIQNGMAVVRFDGTDDVLRGSHSAVWNTGADHTIFTAIKAKVPGGGQIVTDCATDSGLDRRGWQFASSSALIFRDGVGGGNVGNTNITDGVWFVFTGIINGANSRVYVDGANVATGTMSTDTTASSSPIAVGSRYVSPSAGQFLNSDIGEMIIYNGALSDTDRESVESYLRTRWGTP